MIPNNKFLTFPDKSKEWRIYLPLCICPIWRLLQLLFVDSSGFRVPFWSRHFRCFDLADPKTPRTSDSRRSFCQSVTLLSIGPKFYFRFELPRNRHCRCAAKRLWNRLCEKFISGSAAWFFVFILKLIFTPIFGIEIHEKSET